MKKANFEFLKELSEAPVEQVEAFVRLAKLQDKPNLHDDNDFNFVKEIFAGKVAPELINRESNVNELLKLASSKKEQAKQMSERSITVVYSQGIRKGIRLKAEALGKPLFIVGMKEETA